VSYWRYQVMRGIIGLGLAILLILPTHVLIGNLASVMSASVAVGIGIIALLLGAIFGSSIIAQKLSKR
jgi:hypothetical protein